MASVTVITRMEHKHNTPGSEVLFFFPFGVTFEDPRGEFDL